MEDTGFPVRIQAQPDDSTCGPTSLHAVYQFYGDDIPLQRVIDEVETVSTGGTLGVRLANHALRRGYRATIYSYNLTFFDPTWFRHGVDLPAKLRAQDRFKGGRNPKLRVATAAYLEYLRLGGRVLFREMRPRLVRSYLSRRVPILTGLSSTYLYGCAREKGGLYDDVRGEPQGHFVLLRGYDRATHRVSVADPFRENPLEEGQYYQVGIDRLMGALLLGIVTYDANLLVLRPGREPGDRGEE
jgi:hypothetical protein